MLRIQTIVLALTAILGACKSATSTVPNSSPQPVATTTENPTAIKGEWLLRPSYQPHTYRSTSNTVIDELSNPTSTHDTIEQVITYSITLDPTGSQSTLSGHVDTVIFHHRGRVFPAGETTTLPFTITGIISPAGASLDVGSLPATVESKCNPRVNAILNDITRAIATYPAHLNSGLTWKDSTSTTRCIGNEIPTSTKVASSYQVLGESLHNNAGRAILIQRSDSAHFRGEGAQENHQIHLEGNSTGIAKIYIDLRTGLALAMEITQTSEITTISSGERRRFSQHIIQKVELAD